MDTIDGRAIIAMNDASSKRAGITTQSSDGAPKRFARSERRWSVDAAAPPHRIELGRTDQRLDA